MSAEDYNHFDYDLYARKCQEDDFHGQILRTHKGKAISEEQVQLIVSTIKTALLMKPNDVLLDLACGNGSLSKHLFDSCKGYLGVDISSYLIDVALKYFKTTDKVEFLSSSVLDYLKSENNPERFTKLVCFGSIQYFTDKEVLMMLTILKQRFVNISSIFIGNITNLESSELFYLNRKPSMAELTDNKTAIGKWRTKEQIQSIANQSGWKCSLSLMPDSFYASQYRFNAHLF